MDGKVIEGKDSLYASSVIDKDKKILIVKLVNTSTKDVDVKININKMFPQKCNWTELTSANYMDINTLDNPKKIYPVEKNFMLAKGIKADDAVASLTLKHGSVNVLSMPFPQTIYLR
jgi:alpha-N-arabinofuranosidase